MKNDDEIINVTDVNMIYNIDKIIEKKKERAQ